jgi:hypothetical protein
VVIDCRHQSISGASAKEVLEGVGVGAGTGCVAVRQARRSGTQASFMICIVGHPRRCALRLPARIGGTGG